jgi:type III pantothenate kinase
MMSILLVDLGNSRLKWSLYTGSLPLSSRDGAAYREQPLATVLAAQWDALPRPARVMVACVADAATREDLQHWLQTQWSVQPEFLVSPAQALGLRNAYAEPARLGCDRWAAMVAAYHLAGSAVCVVDCGTAITLDVVSADGRHRGGLILPGLVAMQAGLTRHTRLPAVEITVADDALLGRSTEDAIALGGPRAVAALVEQTLGQLTQQYGEAVSCYLTGGDAGHIASRLGVPYRQVSDLVLQGLAVIAGDT